MYDMPQHAKKVFESPVKITRVNIDDPGPVSWKRMLYEQDFLPQHTEKALLHVLTMLGYLPPRYIIREQELFIRAIVEDGLKNNFDGDTLYKHLEPHCKIIRNKDMETGKWIEGLTPTEYQVKCYNTHLVHVREKARKRLEQLLGFLPDLKASLPAELYLREFLNADTGDDENIVTQHDCRAVTITHYRSACIEHGREEADDLSVIGMLYTPRFKLKDK